MLQRSILDRGLSLNKVNACLSFLPDFKEESCLRINVVSPSVTLAVVILAKLMVSSIALSFHI